MSDRLRAWHELALSALASIFLGLLLFLLTGCGGSSSQPAPPPSVPQAQLERWFGYYGDCPTCFAETRGHVNMVWIAGWGGPRSVPEEIVTRTLEAHAAGKRVILMLPGVYQGSQFNPASIPLARGILSALGPARSSVYAFYPVDEPDLHGIGPDAIREANAALRALAAEFGISPRLAVIYAGTDSFPGIEFYDDVSFDDYGAGEAVLGAPLQKLLGALQAGQLAFLTVGGAEPWETAPEPFVARMQADPRIVGVVGFIWFDFADTGVGHGIRSNGLALRYCAAAITVTGGTC